MARLRDEEIGAVDGLPLTSRTRTALDLARSLPVEPAVVVLDAALRERLVDHAALRAAPAGIGGSPGSRAATRAVDVADGRSGSVGECRSRVLLSRLRLAPSTLQLPVLTASGLFLGRAHFGWEEQQVVGEFDGPVEYGRLPRPGREPGDAVFAEKRREDAFQSEGWGVARWTWADLTPGDVVGHRVRRAIERRAR